MKQIRKRLTYANVMSSVAVFLILGGATAVAAKKIGKNDLKANAVTTAKIKRNAVTASKIKNSAITTNKLRNDAVTGAKVNESTLATVPSATAATTAGALQGQINVYVKLGAGQSQTIASHGAVSLVAECLVNDAAKDKVRILAQTSADGAILDGLTDLTGPVKFLNVGTPANERVLTGLEFETGKTHVESAIDQGLVMDPSGKTIVVNSEGIALGLNYAGSTCLAAGVVNLLG